MERKEPDALPKYMPGTAQGVAFDAGSATVTFMGGGQAGEQAADGRDAHDMVSHVTWVGRGWAACSSSS